MDTFPTNIACFVCYLLNFFKKPENFFEKLKKIFILSVFFAEKQAFFCNYLKKQKLPTKNAGFARVQLRLVLKRTVNKLVKSFVI